MAQVNACEHLGPVLKTGVHSELREGLIALHVGQLRWPGRVRPPPRAHRVLHARRRRPPRRHVRAHRRARHGRDRDDRPRQRVRRLRLLVQGQGGRGQADHRHRGLRHAQHLALRQEAGAVERRRRRRRVRLRRLHPHDDVGREHQGHAQPVPALLARLDGGLLLPAPDRPRAADGVRRRTDRHDRLPVRRGPDLAAHRRLREGPRGGRRLPGDPRQGQLLPRADGPRARHRDPRPRRPAAPEQGPRHPAASRPTTRTTSTRRTPRPTSTCSASARAA